MREDYLPDIGYQNIFSLSGYESDDLMATLANHAPHDERVILITGDSDLYQCLRHDSVSLYSPQKKKLLTERWFRATYDIAPAQWALVKAIAGCSSDNVKGIRGVGEATALKYVQGKLPQDSKAYKSIRCSTGCDTVRRNRALVELPFSDCPIPLLVKDAFSRKSWQRVCGKLGAQSLRDQLPSIQR